MLGALSVEKILVLHAWRAQRGEKFWGSLWWVTGFLSSLFGARSVEKILSGAGLGHPFSLLSESNLTRAAQRIFFSIT